MTEYQPIRSDLREQAVGTTKGLLASAWAPPRDTHERAVFRADLAIEMFADSGEPAFTRLSDMLTDLIHWAHEHDVDWASVVDSAEHMMHEDRADWGLSRLAHA